MKATGIVRRIDDLGRVVIPKEIRRTMRIREGDPLEIFTEKDGEVIFKKYSPIGEWSETASLLCEAMSRTSERFTAIADRDVYIAVSGVSKRELHEKHISAEIERIMEARRFYQRTGGEGGAPLVDGYDKFSADAAAPIISGGDVLGCVIFFSEGDSLPGDAEIKLAQTAAAFLGKQLES
ncbi:MAG: AbrB/MazE/SpoVT family DNA-binding domain-containing protein [Oscillospiraceae bacterium]|jgi:AbrB family transcriptional regulator (stage V sporulation protein T)|nr:AbrB/MazE/SpoVT family DNA-binding domain-containing protein [Oscillospiraceae bacterium]